MHNKMQKQVSHLLFLKSSSKRGGGTKWISGHLDINNEHKQSSEKVKVRRFVFTSDSGGRMHLMQLIYLVYIVLYGSKERAHSIASWISYLNKDA